MNNYNFKEIEKKWSKYWDTNKTFYTDVWDFSKPKFYVLDMFPYPSGVGLHVGHPEGYTASDIVSRMKRMQGYNVLHPMGFDSFGLPAEQYAITTGNFPDEFTNKNIDRYITQLKMLGFDYDWSKMVSTCDPKFYKWTQWIFTQLYNDGLAKNQLMPVNWCEELGTVLANDEIIDGKSERGGYPVIKKNMRQLVLDIPAYAERLLTQLDELDWPQSTKEMQRNWIGKSIGAKIKFKINDTKYSFEVFTTRCDTLFGATYCVLAPEHELVLKIATQKQLKAVKDYIDETAHKSERDRINTKEKTGIFTGAYAINPANDKQIPIFIADYVLLGYGTGAIMAVPAHDQRDFEFAKKFKLDIIPVLEGGDIKDGAFEGDGRHINSDFLNGLDKDEAIEKMLGWLEKNKLGKKTVNYRLREWIFARQRYWGEPIPLVYMEDGSTYVLKPHELPLDLPKLADYKSRHGISPLESAKEWKNVKIKNKNGTRETSTMPGSAGSSWYFLRYLDPDNNSALADEKLIKHWLPVDLYIGGSEHVVGHLLYSRFWNNYLYDKGIVFCKEPFKKLIHQGMILGENNEKMSKSRGNVINPDDVVKKFGADALRVFLMFMGPIEAAKPWNDAGIAATKKFLDRVWRVFADDRVKNKPNENLRKVYHETVKKVTNDFETLNYNTAISQLMIFLNAAGKEEFLSTEYAEGFIKLLNPVAPFITEEIWNRFLGHNESIAKEKWPVFDEKVLMEQTVEVPVQINGKLRGKVVVNVDANADEIFALACETKELAAYLKDAQPKKVIYVKGRIFNIVI